MRGFSPSLYQDSKSGIWGSSFAPIGVRVGFLQSEFLKATTRVALPANCIPHLQKLHAPPICTTLTTSFIHLYTACAFLSQIKKLYAKCCKLRSLGRKITTQVPKRPVKGDHGRQRSEQRAWSVLACASSKDNCGCGKKR